MSGLRQSAFLDKRLRLGDADGSVTVVPAFRLPLGCTFAGGPGERASAEPDPLGLRRHAGAVDHEDHVVAGRRRLIAAFTARHPFDYLWNHAVRRAFSAPTSPPNPARRRDAFKVATVWLALVGTLLAIGAATAALILGGMLVAACATVTALGLCLPSEAFAWWERRGRDEEAVAA